MNKSTKKKNMETKTKEKLDKECKNILQREEKMRERRGGERR